MATPRLGLVVEDKPTELSCNSFSNPNSSALKMASTLTLPLSEYTIHPVCKCIGTNIKLTHIIQDLIKPMQAVVYKHLYLITTAKYM